MPAGVLLLAIGLLTSVWGHWLLPPALKPKSPSDCYSCRPADGCAEAFPYPGRMWGSLSPNQRIVAAVISVLVIAAGIYRWVAFGDINRIHGGGGPTSSTLTGESEYLRPAIAEVEESARTNARAEGKLRHLSCHELPNHTWNCALHFLGGVTVIYRGVWNYTRGTLAWSVLQRKATLHFTVPIRQ